MDMRRLCIIPQRSVAIWMPGGAKWWARKAKLARYGDAVSSTTLASDSLSVPHV